MSFTTIVSASLLLVVLVVAQDVEERLPQRPRPLPTLPFRPPCPRFSYDAFYDLENNRIRENKYVTLVEGITGNGEGCSARGVLKLALASAASDPSRRRVLVDLFFSTPSGWVFNLGDSQTNNGYGGDSGSLQQEHDAEVYGIGSNMYGYLSDAGGSSNDLTVPSLYTTRLTLIAGDGHVVWMSNNNNNFNYFHNPYLYALNGQSDATGPVNYDLYLGMNKVIQANSRRIGTGLCRVGIKFLPEY